MQHLASDFINGKYKILSVLLLTTKLQDCSCFETPFNIWGRRQPLILILKREMDLKMFQKEFYLEEDDSSKKGVSAAKRLLFKVAPLGFSTFFRPIKNKLDQKKAEIVAYFFPLNLRGF